MLRLKKLLCPVDFFPASELAAMYAAQLADLYQARLRLIHVVSPVVPMFYDFSVDPAIGHRLQEDSEKQFAKLLSRMPATDRIDTEIRSGDVTNQIEKTIGTFKPDLMVMGSHGSRGFERWIMGSVAARMLRRSPVPVLTVAAAKRRTAPPALRRILVTTDHSKNSPKALDWAFSIAQAAHAHLTIIHVLEEVRALTSATYRAGLIRDHTKKIEKLIPAAVRNVCEVDVDVRAGTPYFEILTKARKDKVNLVIMNTQGKGMVERALLGSTTDRVVRAAECAVLLVPPKK